MNWSHIIGNGKTFTGASILIVSGALSLFGWLPPTLHLDMSPLTAIATGLATIGIGAKLQAIIALAQKV